MALLAGHLGAFRVIYDHSKSFRILTRFSESFWVNVGNFGVIQSEAAFRNLRIEIVNCQTSQLEIVILEGFKRFSALTEGAFFR